MFSSTPDLVACPVLVNVDSYTAAVLHQELLACTGIPMQERVSLTQASWCTEGCRATGAVT